MDGHCGNFNGHPTDKDRLQVRSRVGATSMDSGPEFLFDQKHQSQLETARTLTTAQPVTLDVAKADCKKKCSAFIPPMPCLLDYCFAGQAIAMQQ